MSGFILGEKSDQSQMFNDKGERIPVTFIKTNPCYLIAVKVPEKNSYFALKVGYGQIKNLPAGRHGIKKPVLGELNKAGIKIPLRFLREFRLEKYGDAVTHINESDKNGLAIGATKIFVCDELKPSAIFKKGDMVTISGKTKGKGFQGVVRRHGFAGGPKTHGQSDRHRAPGSIGAGTTPGRVYKGKKMAGRMGGEKMTIKKLEVIEVRDEGLFVRGLVPGNKGGILEVKATQ